jgi:hypothetical protein
MNNEQLKQAYESLTLRVQLLEEQLTLLKSKTPRTSFSPPTMEEVAEYFLERIPFASSEDALNFAEVFISHYTNTNWYYGKKKMKDWKAAMRSAWKLHEFVTTKNNNYESKLGRVQRADLQQWLDS